MAREDKAVEEVEVYREEEVGMGEDHRQAVVGEAVAVDRLPMAALVARAVAARDQDLRTPMQLHLECT